MFHYRSFIYLSSSSSLNTATSPTIIPIFPFLPRTIMQFRPSTIATIAWNSVRVGSFCGWFLVLFFATITTEPNNGGSGNAVVSAFTSAPASALSVSSQWRSHPQHEDARSRDDAPMEPHSFALSMSSILVKDTTTTTTTTPTPQRIRTISRDELIRRIPSSSASTSASTSSNVKTNTNTNTNTAHSKYQLEFRQLLTGIIYTEDELACLRRNPNHRNFHIILTGIAASYDEPAVYRAFEILYEDYAPLRLAGRLVVHQLRKRMQDELVAQQNTSASHRSDSHSPVDAVTAVDPTDPKRTKYNARYNAMIDKFDEWKPMILASNDANGNTGTPTMGGGSRSSQRRFQILRGCFVGSDNPAVLEALRVIYVEYGALRVSGDWIYKVVSALMKPIVHRYHHQKNSNQ